MHVVYPEPLRQSEAACVTSQLGGLDRDGFLMVDVFLFPFLPSYGQRASCMYREVNDEKERMTHSTSIAKCVQ